MIPKDFITEWRASAPWVADRQVEQDLVISRAIVEQKLDSLFTADMTPLLASGQTWSFDAAYDRVWRELVSRLPGEPWKGA